MPKFCSECGMEVNEGDTFCPKCGFNLKGNIMAIKPPAANTTKTVNKKSPATAAILNFLIAGIGYMYLGKWAWGILAFIFIGGVLGSTFLILGGFLIGTLLYLPIDFALAWHAYKLAEEINAEQ
jgi:TM2 domain-containing membrane protein YozV